MCSDRANELKEELNGQFREKVIAQYCRYRTAEAWLWLWLCLCLCLACGCVCVCVCVLRVPVSVSVSCVWLCLCLACGCVSCVWLCLLFACGCVCVLLVLVVVLSLSLSCCGVVLLWCRAQHPWLNPSLSLSKLRKAKQLMLHFGRELVRVPTRAHAWQAHQGRG